MMMGFLAKYRSRSADGFVKVSANNTKVSPIVKSFKEDNERNQKDGFETI
jgi:hypothetical protein